MKIILICSLLKLAHISFGGPATDRLLTDSIPPVVHLTAIQDHQRIMDLLHIDSLRPGPSTNPKSPNADNIREALANPYPVLPDPLRMNNGTRVTSARQWWKKRRPQILEAFDKDIYGRVPRNVPAVHWKVISSKHEIKDSIPVIVKEVVGRVDNSAYPLIKVDIQLTVTTPALAKGPVPVMMDFGFVFPKGFKFKFPPNFKRPVGPDWKELVLDKGWGYAVLIPNSIQPDNGAGLTEGIIGLVNRGQPRKLDDWGALRAWAWGASRALDFLRTDKNVNGREVGIEGVSRNGKAALITMAYDPRFAITLVGSSGRGGAALFRRNLGETVGTLASAGEYHWFCGNFLQYDGPLNPGDLPVDSHELIALCAPCPVFISCGSPKLEGHWEDDRGQFMAEVAAGPVYRLLGKKGLGTDTMPPIGTALVQGALAFRQHHGGHTDGPNWPAFLDYAARFFKK